MRYIMVLAVMLMALPIWAQESYVKTIDNKLEITDIKTTVQTVDYSFLANEKDRMERYIANHQASWDKEKAKMQVDLDRINALMAKAVELGVVAQ